MLVKTDRKIGLPTRTLAQVLHGYFTMTHLAVMLSEKLANNGEIH